MADSNSPSSSISPEWALWEKLLNMGGSSALSPRDYAIEQTVDTFKNGIVDDPAYQADAVVEGTATPIVASRRSTIECDIKALPETDLHIGDLVECFGERWIVVDLYTDKVGIINGEMWVCNNVICFQNHSANVLSRFCVVDDGSYSRRTTDPIAYVPVNTYKLYVPMDSDTVQMYIDKRLAFGKIFDRDGKQVLEVYKIIGMDLKSKNFGEGSHLMVLTMQRDVYNEATDDIENELCDCYVESGDTPRPAPSGGCLIIGRDAIRIGTTRKYIASFTDAHGEPVAGITPVWTVFAPPGVTYTVSQDHIVTIDAPLEDELIGSEVIIYLSDNDGIYGTFEKKVGVITVG